RPLRAFDRAAVLAALVLAWGCGSEGGSGGSDAGTGGTGGTTGPVTCLEDCSAIVTGPCEVAVCNDGRYEGTPGECVVIPAPNDLPCDDGLYCTIGDFCVDGQCVGRARDCGSTNFVCTQYVCDEEIDSCV